MAAHHAWASIRKVDRRLIVRSREVSKPRDSGLDFFIHTEIPQATRQQYCLDACKIAERYDNHNIQSRGFEASRD